MTTVNISNPVQAIYCDNCDSFALAQMEDKFLCDRCLINIIEEGGHQDLEKISPLNLSSFSSTK